MPTDGPSAMEPDGHRQLAKDLFNSTWDLLERGDRSEDDDDRMVHMAHASRFHWGEVGGPEQLARGEWMCSRVYAVLHRPEPALHHARRTLGLCQRHGLGDWDLAYAHEALARACAVAGDTAGARSATLAALAAALDISDAESAQLLLADLETIPGQPRFW